MEVFLISLHYHYIEWILAGKMMNNPMCVPVNRSVYLSKYKIGKALHNVKASPTRTETIIQQIPGGWSIKTLLLIKERKISQVNEFSTFLCIERYKSMVSQKPLH